MCDAVDEPQQLIHLEQQHVLRSHRSSASEHLVINNGTTLTCQLPILETSLIKAPLETKIHKKSVN